MGHILQYLLDYGSYHIIFFGLIASGLGVPIPEDAYVLASGVLAHREVITLHGGLAVCWLGVAAGDALLFHIAQLLGPAVYQRKFFTRVITPPRRSRIEELMDRHGGLIVFASRYLSGFRAPIFAVAAVHGIRFWKFILCDIAAMSLSVPLMFSIGYFFSDQIQRVEKDLSHAKYLAIIIICTAMLIWIAVCSLKPRIARTLEGPEENENNGESHQ